MSIETPSTTMKSLKTPGKRKNTSPKRKKTSMIAKRSRNPDDQGEYFPKTNRLFKSEQIPDHLAFEHATKRLNPVEKPVQSDTIELSLLQCANLGASEKIEGGSTPFRAPQQQAGLSLFEQLVLKNENLEQDSKQEQFIANVNSSGVKDEQSSKLDKAHFYQCKLKEKQLEDRRPNDQISTSDQSYSLFSAFCNLKAFQLAKGPSYSDSRLALIPQLVKQAAGIGFPVFASQYGPGFAHPNPALSASPFNPLRSFPPNLALLGKNVDWFNQPNK